MEPTYLNSENVSLVENLTGEKIVGLKRKLRISNNKTDGESSRDSNVSSSFSTCMPVDSDTYSDSDFEEHPYSAIKKKLLPKTKSVSGNSKVNVNEDEQLIGAYSCRKEKKKTKCMSKNALMARINRQKKKKYIEDLETKNAELEGENQILKDMLNKSIEEAASLKRQAINLHNVIRNSTEIGSLLKCIHKNTDLQISSSLIKDISRKSLSAIGSKFNEPMFSNLTDIPGNEEGKHLLNPPNSLIKTPVICPETYVTNIGLSDDSTNDLYLGQSNMLLDNENVNSFEPETTKRSSRPLSYSQPDIAVDDLFDSVILDSDFRCNTPSRGYETHENEGNLFDDTALLAALVWGMVLHILPALQADVVSNERLQHQL
uniref:BZIP domain-containing protein n=1 Tax=Homalodisca liturata TaxID=320908 RepID=A0A1B6J6E8_9HEMI